MGMLRETWLVLTGRMPQAIAEEQAAAKATLNAQLEVARLRPKYQNYLTEIQRWAASFEDLVSRMEEEGALRKVAYEWWDFLRLPKDIPEIHAPFGYPRDETVAIELRRTTEKWRQDRIEQAMERLEVPRQ